MSILAKFWGDRHENDRKNDSLSVMHSINESTDDDYSFKVVMSTSHMRKNKRLNVKFNGFLFFFSVLAWFGFMGFNLFFILLFHFLFLKKKR